MTNIIPTTDPPHNLRYPKRVFLGYMNEISFVAMASHEFRTPLSAILSSAALLSRYTREDQQDLRDKHIRKIKDSAHQINILLETFLDRLTISAVSQAFPPPPFRSIPAPNPNTTAA